jgi:hypothetical protein
MGTGPPGDGVLHTSGKAAIAFPVFVEAGNMLTPLCLEDFSPVSSFKKVGNKRLQPLTAARQEPA